MPSDLGCITKTKSAFFVQLENSYYRTIYGLILRFLVTFYFIYTMKCDQKVEYGTMKSLIVRISPLYSFSSNKAPNYKILALNGQKLTGSRTLL